MPRSWATSIIGFCAASCVSSGAPSGIVASVKPLIMSITISAGRSPKPILMPKPRCAKNSSSALPLVIVYPSIPPPYAARMAFLHLRCDSVRLAVADGAEHRDPVQQLAADIAGLQHLVLRRLLEQRVDLLVFHQLDHPRAPGRIGHAVGPARRHARAADLQGEAAAAHHHHALVLRPCLDGAADRLAERMAALRRRQRRHMSADEKRH